MLPKGRICDPEDVTCLFCPKVAQRTADGHLYLFYLAEQERPQTGIEGVHGHYFVESSCRLVDVILFGNLQQRVKIGAEPIVSDISQIRVARFSSAIWRPLDFSRAMCWAGLR